MSEKKNKPHSEPWKKSSSMLSKPWLKNAKHGQRFNNSKFWWLIFKVSLVRRPEYAKVQLVLKTGYFWHWDSWSLCSDGLKINFTNENTPTLLAGITPHITYITPCFITKVIHKTTSHPAFKQTCLTRLLWNKHYSHYRIRPYFKTTITHKKIPCPN